MSGLIVEHNDRNLFIIQVFVHCGSMYETDGERGLSHLLEHMLFKSKKDQSVEELLVKLNALGGYFNAITNKDYTSFFIRTVDSNWKESVELLNSIVLQPLFLKDELSKEKKVVMEEFLLYEDDVRDVVFSKAYETFLSVDNPYRHAVKGLLQDICKTNPKQLLSYYSKHYSNMMVYVNCSKAIKSKVIKHVKKSFGDFIIDMDALQKLENEWSPNVGQLANNDNPIVKIISQPKRSQNATVLMFKGFPFKNRSNITLSLIWDILAGSLNSLLMMEIREKRGLVYNISSFNDAYHNEGYTGLYFTSSTNNLADIVIYIKRILRRMANKGLSSHILTYSKASFINKLQYKLTEMDFKSERSMLRHYYRCPWDESAVLKKLHKVTNNDIMNVCKSVFNFQQCCLVSIGKYKKLDDLQADIMQTLVK